MKAMSLALCHSRRWEESYGELEGTGESVYQGVADGGVQGCLYHLTGTSASAFNRNSVLVKTKRWAIAFILKKHLCLRKFKVRGDS